MPEETQDEGADDLQFSAVESATPGQTVAAPQCVVCHRPIDDAYFTAGDKVICPDCRNQYDATLQGGSKFWRFLKATALGVIAGLIGAGIWFGIRYATERDFALVAIGVGLLVGGAVRMGSERRGGRGYQFLALILTYLTVGLAFAPDIVIQGIKEYRKTHAADKSLVAHNGPTTAPTTQRTSAATTQRVGAATTQDAKAVAAASDDTDDEDSINAPMKSPTPKQFALAVALLLVAAVGLVLVGPILVAVSSFPIGTLIVGIGLWEAWKINASKRLKLAGPYSMAGMPPTTPQPLPPTAPGSR